MNRRRSRLLPASLPVSTRSIVVAAGLVAASIASEASAQTTVYSTGFEAPTYTVGNLIPANAYDTPGQDGWFVIGSGAFNSSTYQISSGNGPSVAGAQSLRLNSPTTAGTKDVVKTAYYDTGAPAGFRGYNNRGAGQAILTVSYDLLINSGTVPSRAYGLRLDSDFDPNPAVLQDTRIGGLEVRPGTTSNTLWVTNEDDLGTDGVGVVNTGGTVASNQWVNVKYELDFRVRRARVLVNNVQVGKYYTFNALKSQDLLNPNATFIQNRLSDVSFTVAKNAANPNQGNDSVQIDNLAVVAATASQDWVFTYAANANGSWTDSENWFKRIAPTVRPVGDLTTGRLDVLFPANLITANRVVTVSGTFDPDAPARPVDSITFDSERPVGADPYTVITGYTIGGNGTPGATNPGLLAFSGTGSSPAIRVIRGSHEFLAAAALPSGSTIRVENGGFLRMRGEVSIGNDSSGDFFVKDGDGTFALRQVRVGTAFIDNGTVALTGGGVFNGVSTLNEVFFQAGAKLDVRGPATLLLDSISNSESAVRDLIRDGVIFHSGETSSAVVLGYADVSNFASNVFEDVTADSSTIVLRRALNGDANMDGTVNFDDLLRLAANYNTGGKVWRQGDFNYDGSVNFDDLLKLAANYNQSLTGSLGGDWALAQSAVPEPAGIAAALGAGLAALRRRRR